MDEKKGQALAYFLDELSVTRSIEKTARVFGMFKETAVRIATTREVGAKDARQILNVAAWRLRSKMTRRGFVDIDFYYKGKML